MAIAYLLDEHVPLSYRVQILRRNPDLRVWVIGDPNAPPKSTPDPVILSWCEVNSFILVTNNRRTMPRHLADHLAAGRRVPGIFILNDGMSMGQTIDELLLIAQGSFDDEYRDRLVFLPLF